MKREIEKDLITQDSFSSKYFWTKLFCGVSWRLGTEILFDVNLSLKEEECRMESFSVHSISRVYQFRCVYVCD